MKFKTIRCDGAGENKALKSKCFEEKMGITFEFTAPDTPQHNGMIERSFATSYGRMRAMFHACGINGGLRYSLWAEAANYENYTRNLLVNGKDEKCPHEKFFKEMPSYAKHLTFFGNIGIAKKNIDVKMQSKLKNRGILCMMLGYATDSSGDTYRLLNLNTNAIFKDRNVTWLDKTYGDYVRSKSEFTRKYFDGEDGSSNYNSDSDDDNMVPELNEGAKMTVPTST